MPQVFLNPSEYLFKLQRDSKLSCLPFDSVAQHVGSKAADFLHGQCVCLSSMYLSSPFFLLSALLAFSPADRVEIHHALEHSYLTGERLLAIARCDCVLIQPWRRQGGHPHD
jgi:hypothetical protein